MPTFINPWQRASCLDGSPAEPGPWVLWADTSLCWEHAQQEGEVQLPSCAFGSPPSLQLLCPSLPCFHVPEDVNVPAVLHPGAASPLHPHESGQGETPTSTNEHPHSRVALHALVLDDFPMSFISAAAPTRVVLD